MIGKPLAEDTLIRAAYTFEQNHAYANQVAPVGEGNE